MCINHKPCEYKMWSGSTHPVGTPGQMVTSTTSPENNEAIFEEMGALHPVHGST